MGSWFQQWTSPTCVSCKLSTASSARLRGDNHRESQACCHGAHLDAAVRVPLSGKPRVGPNMPKSTIQPRAGRKRKPPNAHCKKPPIFFKKKEEHSSRHTRLANIQGLGQDNLTLERDPETRQNTINSHMFRSADAGQSVGLQQEGWRCLPV